jgi:large subunit ribosomal protein L29e
MSKSKNHTNHNQGHKNHKNGIKRPIRNKYQSLKCVNAKYLRNRRQAIKKDPKQNKHFERYKKNEDEGKE